MKALDIVNMRKKFNITQEELAKLIGVSRRTIANWESGSFIPAPWQDKLNEVAQKTTIQIGNVIRHDETEKERNFSPQDGVFVPNSVMEILLSQQRTIENLSQSVKAEYLNNNKKSAV